MRNLFENNEVGEEISISEIISIFWKDRKIIFLSVIFFAIFSVFFSLSIPNKYQSNVLIIVNDDSSFNSSAIKAAGGLASLAGVSLPSESNKQAIYLEILKSKSFTNKFINSNNLLIDIMAVEGWNESKNELTYDESIYDNSKKKWVRKPSRNKSSKPSLEEARIKWNEEIFSFSEDKRSGFISITFTHFSPYIAQGWAELFINDLNKHIREIDVDKAQLAINYLKEEAEKTNSEYLKISFYDLIKKQTEKKMLAYTQDGYAYMVVDPPLVPEKKSSPRRALLCIFITIIGAILTLAFSFIKSVFFSNKSKK